jgi:hypothetical protein
MIEAELKLRFARNAHVVIMPNASDTVPVIDGLHNLMDASNHNRCTTHRPIDALRIGDVIEDCELVDRHSHDRFNLPAGVTWRFQRLDVEPASALHPMRVLTLVRVA